MCSCITPKKGIQKPKLHVKVRLIEKGACWKRKQGDVERQMNI